MLWPCLKNALPRDLLDWRTRSQILPMPHLMLISEALTFLYGPPVVFSPKLRVIVTVLPRVQDKARLHIPSPFPKYLKKVLLQQKSSFSQSWWKSKSKSKDWNWQASLVYISLPIWLMTYNGLTHTFLLSTQYVSCIVHWTVLCLSVWCGWSSVHLQKTWCNLVEYRHDRYCEWRMSNNVSAVLTKWKS